MFAYSDAGLKLTKNFEGCRLSAYADQGGVWTVGYGHTGPGVHAGLTITQDQANIFFAKRCRGRGGMREQIGHRLHCAVPV